MNPWTRLEWTGSEEKPRRPYVTDEPPWRRTATPKPTPARCVVCDNPLPRQHGGDTCPKERARCAYVLLAEKAGVALPESATPMIVRPGHEPEMLLIVPTLAVA